MDYSDRDQIRVSSGLINIFMECCKGSRINTIASTIDCPLRFFSNLLRDTYSGSAVHYSYYDKAVNILKSRGQKIDADDSKKIIVPELGVNPELAKEYQDKHNISLWEVSRRFQEAYPSDLGKIHLKTIRRYLEPGKEPIKNFFIRGLAYEFLKNELKESAKPKTVNVKFTQALYQLCENKKDSRRFSDDLGIPLATLEGYIYFKESFKEHRNAPVKVRDYLEQKVIEQDQGSLPSQLIKHLFTQGIIKTEEEFRRVFPQLAKHFEENYHPLELIIFDLPLSQSDLKESEKGQKPEQKSRRKPKSDTSSVSLTSDIGSASLTQGIGPLITFYLAQGDKSEKIKKIGLGKDQFRKIDQGDYDGLAIPEASLEIILEELRKVYSDNFLYSLFGDDIFLGERKRLSAKISSQSILPQITDSVMPLLKEIYSSLCIPNIILNPYLIYRDIFHSIGAFCQNGNYQPIQEIAGIVGIDFKTKPPQEDEKDYPEISLDTMKVITLFQTLANEKIDGSKKRLTINNLLGRITNTIFEKVNSYP